MHNYSLDVEAADNGAKVTVDICATCKAAPQT